MKSCLCIIGLTLVAAVTAPAATILASGEITSGRGGSSRDGGYTPAWISLSGPGFEMSFSDSYSRGTFGWFYAQGSANEVFSGDSSVSWEMGEGTWNGEYAFYNVRDVTGLSALLTVTLPDLKPNTFQYSGTTPAAPFTAEMLVRRYTCNAYYHAGWCDPLDKVSVNFHGTMWGGFIASTYPKDDNSNLILLQGLDSYFTVEGGTWQQLSLTDPPLNPDPAPNPTPEPGTAAVGGAAALLLWMRSRVRS